MFLIVTTLLCSLCVRASSVFDTNTNKTISFETFIHVKSAPLSASNITGLLVPGSTNQSIIDSCDSLLPSFLPLNGSIVLVFPLNGCSQARHAKVAQDAGAAYVLIASPLPFADACIKSGGYSSVSIPVFFLGITDAVNLIGVLERNGEKGVATLMTLSASYNEWYNEIRHFWIFLEIVVLICMLIFALLALRGLYLQIKLEGVGFKLPQICLVTNLVACFFTCLSGLYFSSLRTIQKKTFFFQTSHKNTKTKCLIHGE